MTLSEMPQGELEVTLASLKRFLRASEGEYQKKREQYDNLETELSYLSGSIRSIKGSILTVQQALGLPAETETKAPTLPMNTSREEPAESGVNASLTVMRLVETAQEGGGITFDQILKELQNRGIEISREYLHTILNRKKNHQKKLIRENGRWFLTEKGKEELGLK